MPAYDHYQLGNSHRTNSHSVQNGLHCKPASDVYAIGHAGKKEPTAEGFTPQANGAGAPWRRQQPCVAYTRKGPFRVETGRIGCFVMEPGATPAAVYVQTAPALVDECR